MSRSFKKTKICKDKNNKYMRKYSNKIIREDNVKK